MQDGAIAVPSDKPVKTAAFTSGYGVRSDPFRGGAAMHAGIDLSGPVGTPIYATADGVDHRRRLEQRRLRQSRQDRPWPRHRDPLRPPCRTMAVRAGQRVTRGQLIGRMGSTGRSTGSHLHYEVRIDGRAVNPIPFMKSTDYLVAMQKKSQRRGDGGAGARRPEPANKRRSLPLRRRDPYLARRERA